MKFVSALLMTAAAVLMSGCATSYQEATALAVTGGWRVKQIEGDVYRVSFGANGFTSRETAQTYWLYRCAQTALDNQFDGFEILSNINLVQSLSPQEFFASKEARSAPAAYIYTPMYIDQSSKPFIEADIRLLKKPIEEAPPKVFDAKKLKDALDPYVNGEKCSSGNVCEHVHRYLLPGKKT